MDWRNSKKEYRGWPVTKARQEELDHSKADKRSWTIEEGM